MFNLCFCYYTPFVLVVVLVVAGVVVIVIVILLVVLAHLLRFEDPHCLVLPFGFVDLFVSQQIVLFYDIVLCVLFRSLRALDSVLVLTLLFSDESREILICKTPRLKTRGLACGANHWPRLSWGP